MALRYMGAQLKFFTDCKPLVDVWRQGPGAGTDAGDPMAYLWREVWRLVSDRGVGAVEATHVEAHSPASAVADGVITAWQRFGNAQADASAKRGAAMHPDAKMLRDAHRASRGAVQ
eukprot:6893317-Pyramimonas_sp.AAC.1